MYLWKNPITSGINVAKSFAAQARREGWYEVLRQFMQTKTIRLHGNLIGIDGQGNKYYEAKSELPHMTRWVVYAQNNRVDASLVPPEWDQWLHQVSDVNPATNPDLFQRYDYMIPRLPNQLSRFGYNAGYLPPGYYSRQLSSTEAGTDMRSQFATDSQITNQTSGSGTGGTNENRESTGRVELPDENDNDAPSAGTGRIQGVYQPWQKEPKSGKLHRQEFGQFGVEPGSPLNDASRRQSGGAGTQV